MEVERERGGERVRERERWGRGSETKLGKVVSPQEDQDMELDWTDPRSDYIL